jgi:hypothetical protein
MIFSTKTSPWWEEVPGVEVEEDGIEFMDIHVV